MSMIGHNNPVVNIENLTDGQKKQVLDAMKEMDASLTRIASERELQKEVINTLCEDLGVDKKLFRKLAKAYHKSDFRDEVQFNEEFENSYRAVVKEIDE